MNLKLNEIYKKKTLPFKTHLQRLKKIKAKILKNYNNLGKKIILI